jgi:hypothetical protein
LRPRIPAREIIGEATPVHTSPLRSVPRSSNSYLEPQGAIITIREREPGPMLNLFDFFLQNHPGDSVPEPPGPVPAKKAGAGKAVVVARKAAPRAEPSLDRVAFLDDPQDLSRPS